MNNRHVAALLFWCLLALFPRHLRAQDNDITVEGSNLTRWDHGEEVDVRRAEFVYPDNTIARRFIENRLRLDVFRGRLRLGGRLLYFRPSEGDKVQYGVRDEGRVDKRFLEASFDGLKLRAGHFSDLWGQGLVLSLFENRELYFDSELDGVRAEADIGPLQLTGLRGNSTNGFLVREADITGVRVSSLIGGSGIGFSYASMDSGHYPAANTAGIDWRIARGIFTLYGERAWKETVYRTQNQEGHATYVGMVLSMWSWSLLFDYKDYAYDAPTPFQNPPTVYREIGPRLLQGREPHVLHPENEVGIQAELSGRALPRTFLTLHYNLTSRHPKHDAFIIGLGDVLPLPGLHQEDWPYREIFVSVEQELPEQRSLFVELGNNEQAAVQWQERTWGWLKFRTPVGRAGTIDLETEQMRVKDRLRSNQIFHDHLYSFGWEPSGSLTLTVLGQFTNDDRLQRREGEMWLSGEAAVLIGNAAHRMIAFYGRERGGLRCSSGVCRQMQAFEGARLTLEISL